MVIPPAPLQKYDQTQLIHHRTGENILIFPRNVLEIEAEALRTGATLQSLSGIKIFLKEGVELRSPFLLQVLLLNIYLARF